MGKTGNRVEADDGCERLLERHFERFFSGTIPTVEDSLPSTLPRKSGPPLTTTLITFRTDEKRPEGTWPSPRSQPLPAPTFLPQFDDSATENSPSINPSLARIATVIFVAPLTFGPDKPARQAS